VTARTSWAAGSLPGTTTGAYTAGFVSSDLNSLASLSSVMSSTVFDNTVATITTPDQFMDISFVGALTSSSTIASGAGLGIWLACLQGDGTTYGTGRMTSGTAVVSTTFVPLQCPLGGIPIEPGTTQTNIIGCLLCVPIPPRAFKLIIQNQTGFALAASGNNCYISTYRQNTNA
jgi:hypothetical protein